MKRIRVTIEQDTIVVGASCGQDWTLERMAFQDKKKLLEEIAGNRVELRVWEKQPRA